MAKTTFAIVFEAERTDYSPEQVRDERHPITAGELIRFLEDYDEDTPIIISHDRGYTYGTLNIFDSHEYEFENEDEDEDEE